MKAGQGYFYWGDMQLNKCKNCKYLKAYYFEGMGYYCDNYNSENYKDFLNRDSAGCKSFEVRDVKVK